MIELRHVYKEYSGRKNRKTLALSDVSLTLGDSGLVCLVGASGCGKTTILNIIGTLDAPSSGELYADGKNIGKMSGKELNEYRAVGVGFIFQELNLIEGLTVRDNLRLVCNKEDIEGKHAELLHKLEIDEFADKLPKELSGGQRQRVAIARALVKGSRVLLCDEPTGSLDPDNAVTTFELLKEISKERLVVVVSHDVATASKYADRIVRLEKGKIVEDTQEKDVDSACWSEPSTQTTGKFVSISKRQRIRGLGKLAAQYVKCNPIRLTVMTVISILVFTFLSVANSLSGYDRNAMIADVMHSKGIRYFTVKHDLILSWGGSEPSCEWNREQADYLANSTGCDIDPIYSFFAGEIPNLGTRQEDASNYEHVLLDSAESCGVVHYTDDFAARYGCKLYGERPIEENDIVIGEYIFNLFKVYGYQEDDTCETIRNYSDIIGKTLYIKRSEFGARTLTITGVLNTGFDEKRYAPNRKASSEERWRTYEKEFYCIKTGSLHNVYYVSDAFFAKNIATFVPSTDSDKDFYIDISLYGSAGTYLKSEADENFLANVQVFCPSDMDIHDNAIFLDTNTFYEISPLGFGDAYNPNAEELSSAVNAYASKHPVFTVAVSGSDYKQDVPFGGVYVPNYTTHANVCVRESLLNKMREEYREYVRDNPQKNLRRSSGMLVPAKSKKESKRILSYDELLINIKRTVDLQGSIMETTKEKYHIENEATAAVKQADKVFRNIAKYVKYAFLGLAMIALLIIFLYFSALLSSREKDVGVLRTNGYTKCEITLLFIFEALIISVGFIVLSIVTSAIAIPVFAAIINHKYDFLFTPISFTMRQVGLIVGFQLLFSAVGILIPLLLLLRKKPMEIINAGK